MLFNQFHQVPWIEPEIGQQQRNQRSQCHTTHAHLQHQEVTQAQPQRTLEHGHDGGCLVFTESIEESSRNIIDYNEQNEYGENQEEPAHFRIVELAPLQKEGFAHQHHQ